MFCQELQIPRLGHTKKLEHSPTHCSVSANSEGGEHKNNICFSEVNFLLVGALMNIGRQNKFLLIEPSALEHKLV